MRPPQRWWWVRHAPVEPADGRIHGQADVPCDTSDTLAMAALARCLPTQAMWIISPLRRTAQTFAAISAAAATPLPPPRIEADFSEQHFGHWQGMRWPEMEAADPDGYRAFWLRPTRTAPPGGESFLAQMRRTERAIGRLGAAITGGDVVCISHAGTIRAAVALALGLTPEAAMAVVIDNLSLTRLEYVEDGLLRGHGGSWLVRTVNQPCR